MSKRGFFVFNQIDWKRNCDDSTLEDESRSRMNFEGKDITYILNKSEISLNENLFQDIKIKDWWIHGCQLFSGFRFSFTKRMQANICEHLHVEILDKQRAKTDSHLFPPTSAHKQRIFFDVPTYCSQMLPIICDDTVRVRVFCQKNLFAKNMLPLIKK